MAYRDNSAGRCGSLLVEPDRAIEFDVQLQMCEEFAIQVYDGWLAVIFYIALHGYDA